MTLMRDHAETLRAALSCRYWLACEFAAGGHIDPDAALNYVHHAVNVGGIVGEGLHPDCYPNSTQLQADAASIYEFRVAFLDHLIRQSETPRSWHVPREWLAADDQLPGF